VRSIERNSLDVVDFLGAEASVDAGGQLERVLGSRSHERFHSDLDALAFRNSGAFDRLENSVLEDCLEGGFRPEDEIRLRDMVDYARLLPT
jgi:hypothetical protein